MGSQHTRMEREVRRVAQIVARDIGIVRGIKSVDCFYLTERGGGPARHVILEPGIDGMFAEGRERGYDIFISLQIDPWLIPVVMIHELAHRFTATTTSSRYDELNTARLAHFGFDRQEFLEAVADRVEALFLYACYR